jgi:hypothetical protein
VTLLLEMDKVVKVLMMRMPRPTHNTSCRVRRRETERDLKTLSKPLLHSVLQTAPLGAGVGGQCIT